MRVLITGGAGFLGSHLCEKLLACGHKVICLDNYYTGSKRNVEHLLKNVDFELVEHDVINPINIKCDWIFNLACPASPIHYQKDSIFTTKTSVFGILNVLELARRNGARVLQTSTSEIYGDPREHPQHETYWGHVNPIGPRSCYDEGKRVAECLMMDYHRQHNVEIRIARIFNTYGQRMSPNDGRVVSNFIVQALRGEPITIYGDGKQTRSFCHVSDMVEGLIRLMTVNDYVKPVNIGNPNEFTVLYLANMVLELTKSKSKIIYKALPVDDPVLRCPSIEVAKRLLDWQPTVELKEGLMYTIDYFRSVGN